MNTILKQIGVILNTRTLHPLNESSDGFEALTQAHITHRKTIRDDVRAIVVEHQ